MGEKNNQVMWVADFETTTNEDDCRVWAWGGATIDEPDTTFVYGNLISTFIDWCQDKQIVYFHNLAFDGAFILDFLMKRGWICIEGTLDNPYQITTLISAMGKFYTIRVMWENGVVTEFRDSLKKLPLSVSNIAKAFDLEESKGVIDYDAKRAIGHQLTSDEIEYLKNDVVIVAKALAHQFEQNLTKLTMGADSLWSYRQHITNKLFSNLFPTLPISMDADIRRSYKGGFTFLQSKFAGKNIGDGVIYDVNSLYPSVMMYELLPHGNPRHSMEHDVYESDGLAIMAMSIVANLKPNHVPCIPIKSGMFVATQYHVESDLPIEVCCTSVDFKLWNEHYDIDVIEFHGAWLFDSHSGMFTDWIEHWKNIKENAEGPMRLIAKLQLNNLYGKFATNPNVTGKVPYLDKNIVKYALGRDTQRSPVYTPMGSFITAYARAITIRAAQANYDRFIYADTDSLHLTGTEPAILDKVDDNEFGAWAHESTFDDGIYVRPKCYGNEFIMCGDKKCSKRGSLHTHTHVAGLPVVLQQSLTLSDFKTGKKITGKLLPKRVPGGIVLYETEFELKPVQN